MSEDSRRRRRSGQNRREEELRRQMMIRQAARRRKQRERKRKVFLLRVLLAAALCICVVIIAVNASSRSAETKESETAEGGKGTEISGEEGSTGESTASVSGESPAPAEPPVSIIVSAAGDCTLGTDEHFDQSRSFNAYYDEYGASYFFQNVKSVFDADDLTIVNMEGTLTDETERQDKSFAFKGPSSYAQVLTEGGVEAVNLANNHSRDYGEQSYIDTIGHLGAAGIISFGYDRTAVLDVKGVQVGLVGVYELSGGMDCEEEMIANIRAVEEQGAQIVIVSFHWGEEKAYYPDETQVALAHSAVDNGADLVLGHHPHVLEGIEEYKGKNIVYSLGNFCFGGNSNPSDKDTMIFQQTFTVEDGELKEDNVTNIIPCSLSSVSDSNNYQPTPLEGEEAERVLDKIEEYSSGL
jgi:poly-gamma-glutamate capsule biosynthesis protein CapA/YwtB (metallophosphatase superfamily)